MFDFNNDGKTDASEEFMAHEIFKDVMEPNQEPRVKGRIELFDTVMIALFIWYIIDLLFRL